METLKKNENMSAYLQGERITGIYTLRDINSQKGKTGQPYLRINFNDNNRIGSVYVWNEKLINMVPHLKNKTVYIEVNLSKSQKTGEIFPHLNKISEHFPFGERYLSKVKEYFYKASFENLFDTIQTPALKTFLETVFSDASLKRNFMCVPGSTTHHHNYYMGLLVHSIDCAELVYQQLQMDFDRKTVETATIAALLHDIGKTMLYAPLSGTSKCRYINSHENYSHEIIGSALKKLRTEMFDAAEIISLACNPKKFAGHPDYQPKSLIVELIRDADRMSSHSNLLLLTHQQSKGSSEVVFRGNQGYLNPSF